MDLKPYYFIYFLDSEFRPNDSDIFIPLYPSGYLMIGEGVWPESGIHSTENAYFTLEAAREALKKIQLILGSTKARTNLSELRRVN